MNIKRLKYKLIKSNFIDKEKIEKDIDDLISEIFNIISSVNKNDVNGIAGDWTYGKLNDDGARGLLKELQKIKKELREHNGDGHV
jgi:hypothetical protein